MLNTNASWLPRDTLIPRQQGVSAAPTEPAHVNDTGDKKENAGRCPFPPDRRTLTLLEKIGSDALGVGCFVADKKCPPGEAGKFFGEGVLWGVTGVVPFHKNDPIERRGWLRRKKIGAT